MAVQDNKSYYDEFSDWYEKERHEGYHRLIDDLQVDLLWPHIQNQEVLEVGCGTGLLLERVAQGARRAKGIDISPGMLEVAEQRGLDVEEGSATDLPYQDESFDVVYSFKVLAHIEEIERALSECGRVVKPGGKLFLEFYNPQSLRYLVKQMAGPQKISTKTRESAVYTRWDTPQDVMGYMPTNVEIEGWSGVRIFTPAAAAHRVPGVAEALRNLEFMGRDTPLGRFGGFLVACARRQP